LSGSSSSICSGGVSSRIGGLTLAAFAALSFAKLDAVWVVLAGGAIGLARALLW
jgi:hypothetical protein